MQKNKQKLLKILEILKETDELHPITVNRIINRLKSEGIDAERKSVLRDIGVLNECGYEIILHHDNKLGFYLANPIFEDWELKFLADAVFSARFLTKSETEKLAQKIYSQSSTAGEKRLKSFAPVLFDTNLQSTYRHLCEKTASSARSVDAAIGTGFSQRCLYIDCKLV